MWQVSGAHGRIDPKKLSSMFKYMASRLGILQTIMATAEDFIGEFRRLLATRGKDALSNLQAYKVPRPTRNSWSSRTLIFPSKDGVETFDPVPLVGIRDQNYLDALRYMSELQSEGKSSTLA